MGRGKIEKKKIENWNSRHVAFCKRRASLFKKAHELAVLCDAEVAIILFSADGKISEFASSNMERILTRFSMCLKNENLPVLKFMPEEPKDQVTEEVEALRQEEQEVKLNQWKLLGKDLTHMGSHELLVLEERLTEGMLYIKDRKMQILMEELEQSRMQEQQELQKNQTLQRLVEELQGSFPPIGYPMPLSVHFPETEGNVIGPADRQFLPSTSFAVPLAINNGPETECNHEPLDKDLDTTLSLAPTWVGGENKTPEGEARSSINVLKWDGDDHLISSCAIGLMKV